MKRYSALLGFTLMVGPLALAQDANERVVVPARNTTHPRKVDVNLMGGSITVKSYAGKEVIVEARELRPAANAIAIARGIRRPKACAAWISRRGGSPWKKKTTW